MEIKTTTTITKCESKYYPMSKGKTCTAEPNLLFNLLITIKRQHTNSQCQNQLFKKNSFRDRP